MKQINSEQYLKTFLKDRNISDRYASYDFCFNYFQWFKNKQDIISPENIEKSCLHLWFYLASRWMYRWSSFLLQKSMEIYKELLQVVVNMNPKIWTMDVDNYPWNENFIIDCYNQIKESFIIDNERHIVLITKIMLGLFGCIPAYDQFFTKGLSEIVDGECWFTSVNKQSLESIYKFYKEKEKIINKYANETETLRFDPKQTNKLYTKAKIIDMIGFTYGLENSKKEKIF